MTAFEADTLRFQLDRLTKEHNACSPPAGDVLKPCGKHECLFCYGAYGKYGDGWCLMEPTKHLCLSMIQHKDNFPKASDDERSALIGATLDSEGNCVLNVHSEGIVPLMFLFARILEASRVKFKMSEKDITDLALRAYKVLKSEGNV